MATASFVVLWLLTIEVVLGFACRPVQAFWGAAPGACLDLVAFGYFTNTTNLAADLWIFALPIPMLLGLQAKLSKKVGLCLLFSVGLGTCAISAARLTWVFSFGSTDTTCKFPDLVCYPYSLLMHFTKGPKCLWESCRPGSLAVAYWAGICPLSTRRLRASFQAAARPVQPRTRRRPARRSRSDRKRRTYTVNGSA